MTPDPGLVVVARLLCWVGLPLVAPRRPSSPDLRPWLWDVAFGAFLVVSPSGGCPCQCAGLAFDRCLCLCGGPLAGAAPVPTALDLRSPVSMGCWCFLRRGAGSAPWRLRLLRPLRLAGFPGDHGPGGSDPRPLLVPCSLVSASSLWPCISPLRPVALPTPTTSMPRPLSCPRLIVSGTTPLLCQQFLTDV